MHRIVQVKLDDGQTLTLDSETMGWDFRESGGLYWWLKPPTIDPGPLFYTRRYIPIHRIHSIEERRPIDELRNE